MIKKGDIVKFIGNYSSYLFDKDNAEFNGIFEVLYVDKTDETLYIKSKYNDKRTTSKFAQLHDVRYWCLAFYNFERANQFDVFINDLDRMFEL